MIAIARSSCRDYTGKSHEKGGGGDARKDKKCAASTKVRRACGREDGKTSGRDKLSIALQREVGSGENGVGWLALKSFKGISYSSPGSRREKRSTSTKGWSAVEVVYLMARDMCW